METRNVRHSNCDKKRNFPGIANLNERQRRLFYAKMALDMGRHGVKEVCKEYGVSKNTVYRGIHELKGNRNMESGRIRKQGGGRKRILDLHPEYKDIFCKETDDFTGGLPQNEDIRMLFYPIPVVIDRFSDRGIAISRYIVEQLISSEGLKKRKPKKCTSMAECENRNEQFEKISEKKQDCIAHGIPVFSIDTKKKELIGPFRRDGQVFCSKAPKTKDHDFPSFADGKIVPWGIFDIKRNAGYMSFGTNHDTAEFACDNIRHHWNSSLKYIYPSAKCIMLLCDGGGSNSSSSKLFKQKLIELSIDLKVDIIVAHYPPYTSKWNPIEHRLFSQITRVWKGVFFNSIEQACELAGETRTKKGLCVLTSINKNYTVLLQKLKTTMMKFASNILYLIRSFLNGIIESYGKGRRVYQVNF